VAWSGPEGSSVVGRLHVESDSASGAACLPVDLVAALMQHPPVAASRDEFQLFLIDFDFMTLTD
jgi:hypothetical protein